MADILTTSSIESLVSTYKASETTKSVTPLKARKDKYSGQSSAYDTLITKLNALKTQLTSLNQTGSDSIFSYKKSESSNATIISASASSSALPGSYEMRVNQLAKKDTVLSGMFLSTDVSTLTGKHKFNIVSGDGEGGEFVSSIEVEFSGTETNKSAVEKIQNAINADKAVVEGSSKVGTDTYSGGASTFKVNIGGTETTITVDGTAATYSDLMDSIVSSINDKVDGVTAAKIVDPLDPTKFKLSLTVDDSSKYISISSDTGFNLVTDLNIGVTQEKGASGIVSASSFSPQQGYSQLSLTAKESGLGNRIMSLSDESTYSALSAFNLNLGSARPAFNQGTNTPGFLYTDITASGNLLNAKINFNGLDLQRNSNTIDDIAEGVTVTLKSTMTASENNINISVANDITAIKDKVASFITTFNDLYTYLRSSNTFVDGNRGVLYGDANAQTLLSYLSSTAFSNVSGLSVNSLNSIGITFNSSTGLTLSDSSKFESKINSSPDQVASLFNSTNGLSQVLYSKINPYVGSGGYLNSQKSSITRNIKSINDRIKATETRIDKSVTNLRNRYEMLQQQYATLLTTQNYFSS